MAHRKPLDQTSQTTVASREPDSGPRRPNTVGRGGMDVSLYPLEFDEAVDALLRVPARRVTDNSTDQHSS
jgi:hypothetical protein